MSTPTPKEPETVTPVKPREQRYCAQCGKALSTRGKFCNASCKQKAYRERVKEKA